MSDIAAFASDMRVAGMSSNTIKAYVRVLKLVPFELPGSQREVKDWLAQRREVVSVNSTIAELRAVKCFSRWWAAEYDEPDPLERLRFPKPTKPLPGRVAKAEDIDVLIERIEGTPDRLTTRDVAIIRTLQFTGMRSAECARLHVEDVDFEGHRIAIREAKNGEARHAPIHPTARRALKRYLRDRDASQWAYLDNLWLTRDGAITSDGLRQMLVQRCKQFDVPKLTPHTFRRGFAHAWAEAGMPDDTLMLIAGWRNPIMPSRYRAELAKERAVIDFERAFPSPKLTLKIKPGRRAS